MENITTLVSQATRSGLSWTKRSRLINECLAELIDLGRSGITGQFDTKEISIKIASNPTFLEIDINGLLTDDIVNIRVSLTNGAIHLDGSLCDLTATSQKVASLFLKNKPREVETVVYC